MLKFNQTGRLRWYWLFPAVALVYAMFGSPNTPGFAWWAFLGAIACGLPLLVTRHDPLSFVSITALLHALYYPMALILNLIASFSGVYEWHFWNATPLAMQVLVIGMGGFALGAKIGTIIWPAPTLQSTQAGDYEIVGVSPSKLFGLCLLIIPLAVFKLATGTYYHILAAGSLGWSERSALAYAYIGYVEYMVYAGVFLQMRRYLITGARKDLVFAIACAVLPVLVMLPSGSRDLALRGSVPAVMVALIGFKKIFSRKTIVLTCIAGASILILMGAVESYRGTVYYELRSPTPKDRLDLLGHGVVETLELVKEDVDQNLRLWGRRFADYVVVGQIVNMIPSVFEHRWFEDMQYWPIYLLPKPIRPATPNFDPRDSATLSFKVEVFPGLGSSPAMIVGDLYSRFSWPGVFFGMAGLGFVFIRLDKRLRRLGLFESLLYGLLLLSVSKLPQESLFGYFLFFTRNMVIVFLIGKGLKFFLQHKRGRLSRSFGYQTPELKSAIPKRIGGVG